MTSSKVGAFFTANLYQFTNFKARENNKNKRQCIEEKSAVIINLQLKLNEGKL